jgi:hypothetical protein
MITITRPGLHIHHLTWSSSEAESSTRFALSIVELLSNQGLLFQTALAIAFALMARPLKIDFPA